MSLLLPGQPINTSGKPGVGTYVDSAGTLRASLIGYQDSKNGAIIVARSRPHAPSENSLVIGTIVRLTSQQAVVSISVVDGIPLPDGEDYTGIIRTQDVRMTEKDKVKIGDCFRNGDVVRGIVISLGDARSYYLSTARNDLGVLFATSEAGLDMEVVSWEYMKCPSGRLEKRKVARPGSD